MKTSHESIDASEIQHVSVQSTKHVRVLVVDDDPVIQAMLEAELETLGFDVTLSSGGKEALDILRREIEQLDVVLLDRQMPDMGGLEVVAEMGRDPQLKNIPVIMQTSSDKPEEIKQGIDAGVYYYLTKPVEMDVLNSVVTAAVNESRNKKQLGQELKQHRTSFGLIENCKFSCHSLSEAESLACFVANCYPEPDRVVTGLADLLINAIEHGNLGIDYEEKTHLIAEGTWRQEVIQRSQQAEHKDKRVEVLLERKPDGIYAIIRDQGKGFNWRNYMKIDPARAQDNHGRGIAQASAVSFDKLIYNETGNEVTAFVSYESKMDW